MPNTRWVSEAYLARQTQLIHGAGYPTPKWIQFCEYYLALGFGVKLHRPSRTVSKYITLYHNNKTFRVRFSNHRPLLEREISNDCDFFIGHTRGRVTTTQDAINAANKYFGVTVNGQTGVE